MEQLKNKDFLEYQYLSSLKNSPNKEYFSFVKAHANYEKNKYEYELYLSDGFAQKHLINLKDGPSYFWETDETVLLPKTEEKETKVKIINIFTKELIEDFSLPFPASSFEKIDEEKYIVSASLNPDFFNEPKEHDTNLYEIIETIPFYSNGQTFTRSKVNQLFIYNKFDKKYEQISNFEEIVTNYYFDKDASLIYFTSIPNSQVLTFHDQVYSYNIKTNERATLYNKNEYSIADLIPLNNKLYVMANDMKSHGINENSDFYLLENNELKFVHEFSLSANNSIGSDARLGGGKNRRIVDNVYYFVGTYHTSNRLYSFDGEKIDIVIEPKGSIDNWIFYKSKIMTIHLSDNRLQELAFIDEKETKLVSMFNNNILENKYIAKPEHIQFENDGQKLDGWILYPRDYVVGVKYPAILDIHGGPKTIYSDVFYHEMQVWANDGYFVFFANPRGGDAYGDDFADIRGKYGTIDYDDLMTFTDLVLDKYPIDPDKVGVTGGSYGGFMTNWIVSHTDRFKAAATQRSISNWISFYGTSDIGYYFASDQTDANPYEKHDEMWEQSPLKHAQNINTPLLFIHSEQDYRCPVEQAMQLYTVVKEKGVDTRFIWFKNENHDLSRSGSPKNRLTRLEEIHNWMNKYLK